MQALTMKVEEQLLQAEAEKNEKIGRMEMSKKDKFSMESGKKLVRSIARLFCYASLKMQLKEIGSHIKCAGKVKLFGTKNIKIGNATHFGKNVQLHTEGRGYIHIGANVKIGKGVKLFSHYSIIIEDNTHIENYVVIRDAVKMKEETKQKNGAKPVYIGKNVWIGKGTRIHAGVTIGHEATLSANSVVTHSIPPKVIAGGTPAKVIINR
jgi:acetyltransferase-like isoleucine patch superfamily enzyme